MTRASLAEARAFASWLDYQHALTRAIAPLTIDQLQQRPLPGRRTPGEIAQHIVFGRALHVHRTLGDEAAELLPFIRWGDADAPQRTAAEIVHGLEVTWRAIAEFLMRGAPSDEIPATEEPTPQQVIWGLLDHDLPHAGQLSLLLRAGGMPGVDI